jgi:hypothetical protein
VKYPIRFPANNSLGRDISELLTFHDVANKRDWYTRVSF